MSEAAPVWAGVAALDDATADAAELARAAEAGGGTPATPATIAALARFPDTGAAASWLRRAVTADPGTLAGAIAAGPDAETAESALAELLASARAGEIALAADLHVPDELAGWPQGTQSGRGHHRRAPDDGAADAGAAAADGGAKPEEATNAGARGGLRPGMVLSNTYEIEEWIAQGGMGAIYRATHLDLGTRHAIKAILPEYSRDEQSTELFRREAGILRAIRHDAVVGSDGTIRDADGNLYMVMEYAQGPALNSVIREGTLTWAQAETLAARIGAGLDAAHDKGIRHSDISPDNIVLVNGRVDEAKIIDFGVARNYVANTSNVLQGQFAGKLTYAAPEEYDDGVPDFTKPVDSRADIYSMGLVLAAALGHPLHHVPAPERCRDLPFPEPWASRLQAMLRVHPDARPNRFSEILDTSGSPPHPAPAAQPRRWGALAATAAALVVVAAAGAGTWMLRDRVPVQRLYAWMPFEIGAGPRPVAPALELNPAVEPRPQRPELDLAQSGAGGRAPETDPVSRTEGAGAGGTGGTTRDGDTESAGTADATTGERPKSPPDVGELQARREQSTSVRVEDDGGGNAARSPAGDDPTGGDVAAASQAGGQPDRGAAASGRRDAETTGGDTDQPSSTGDETETARAAGEATGSEGKAASSGADNARAQDPGPQIASVSAVRRDVSEAVGTIDCGAVQPQLTRGEAGYTVTLTGVAPRPGVRDRVRRRVAGLDAVRGVQSQLAVHPPPLCRISAVLAGVSEGPSVRLNHPSGVYRDGERLEAEITAGGPGTRHVYVNLLTDQGKLVHMLPNRRIPDNTFQPGETVTLGAPGGRPDYIKYRASPPFGDNLLVAVSSPEPLFEQPPAAVQAYARALKTRLDAVDGARAAIETLETRR